MCHIYVQYICTGLHMVMCVADAQSLIQHYHHSVAVEAKKMEQPLPKLESDLAAQLDTTVDDVGISVLQLCLICVICYISHGRIPKKTLHTFSKSPNLLHTLVNSIVFMNCFTGNNFALRNHNLVTWHHFK